MLQRLSEYISSLESVLICYSGGTDSSLLLKVCSMIPEIRAEAVFFDSIVVPRADMAHAVELARHIAVPLTVLQKNILAVPGLKMNPENRCYLCKQHMLSSAIDLARGKGIKQVIEGSHADDLKEIRPGRQAIKELHVVSPFEAVGMGKKEIRDLSRELGLDTWNRPSFSCLMTRLPHDTEVKSELLARMDRAEQFLRDLGMQNFRVRHKSQTSVLLELSADDEKIYRSEQSHIDELFYALGYQELATGSRA